MQNYSEALSSGKHGSRCFPEQGISLKRHQWGLNTVCAFQTSKSSITYHSCNLIKRLQKLNNFRFVGRLYTSKATGMVASISLGSK